MKIPKKQNIKQIKSKLFKKGTSELNPVMKISTIEMYKIDIILFSTDEDSDRKLRKLFLIL